MLQSPVTAILGYIRAQTIGPANSLSSPDTPNCRERRYVDRQMKFYFKKRGRKNIHPSQKLFSLFSLFYLAHAYYMHACIKNGKRNPKEKCSVWYNFQATLKNPNDPEYVYIHRGAMTQPTTLLISIVV